jgi:hypothetical protein
VSSLRIILIDVRKALFGGKLGLLAAGIRHRLEVDQNLRMNEMRLNVSNRVERKARFLSAIA